MKAIPIRRTITTSVVFLTLIASVMASGVTQESPDHAEIEADLEALSEEGHGHASFNESSGCGSPATSNPKATRTGFVSDSELVRGYKGGFFGRTIGAVKDELVPWTMPMSGGLTFNVHERALPAFQLVTQNLAAAQAAGNWYTIRPEHTFGYAARTVGGRHSFSNHAFGTTIDINSTTNPFRSDNTLITDMPDWFVKAWTDAGFCWGGSWNEIKDPMHYSWMGPDATPGYGSIPADFAPNTELAAFASVAASYPIVFGEPKTSHIYVLADATGNGLADAVRFTDETFGTKVDWSRTHRLHEWCAADRTNIVGVDIGNRSVLFGDFEGNGRFDVWLFDTGSDTVEIEVVLRSEDFESSKDITTAIVPLANDVFLLGDNNSDGVVDIYVVRRDGGRTSLEVWDGASEFSSMLWSGSLDVGRTTNAHFALTDRNLDSKPDLVVLDDGQLEMVLHDESTVSETLTIPGLADLVDIAMNDFDGDGRDDLITLDDAGTYDVRLGNTALPGATSLTSWFVESSWECDEDATLYDYTGLFRDDDPSVHEADIDLIGRSGITVGCNPPQSDEFCPASAVTRGQMAAFLVRALDLPTATDDFFGDDDGTLFESAINALAAAGITKGCNPPANTKFCPSETLTRGEMAAFLVRAFNLPEIAGSPSFSDVAGSIFTGDIQALAAAGITLGCNPPANTRFCPEVVVSRQQMASFLIRALG